MSEYDLFSAFLTPTCITPVDEWSQFPLFDSPIGCGPLSTAGSDISEGSSSVCQSDVSRKRRRAADDDEEHERKRSAKACTECRRAKAKCRKSHDDGDSACTRCASMGKSCVFVEPGPRKDPAKRIASLQRQLEHMEEMHRLLDEALRRQAESRSRPLSRNVRN